MWSYKLSLSLCSQSVDRMCVCVQCWCDWKARTRFTLRSDNTLTFFISNNHTHKTLTHTHKHAINEPAQNCLRFSRSRFRSKYRFIVSFNNTERGKSCASQAFVYVSVCACALISRSSHFARSMKANLNSKELKRANERTWANVCLCCLLIMRSSIISTNWKKLITHTLNNSLSFSLPTTKQKQRRNKK